MAFKTSKDSILSTSPTGVNQSVIVALKAVIDAKRSPAEAARHLGVNQSQINRWLSGETKWITPQVWQRLEPFLRPYLPSDMSPRQIPVTNPAPAVEKVDPGHEVELKKIRGCLIPATPWLRTSQTAQ